VIFLISLISTLLTLIYSIRVTQEIFVSAPKREVISSQAEINVVIRGAKLETFCIHPLMYNQIVSGTYVMLSVNLKGNKTYIMLCNLFALKVSQFDVYKVSH
jgi:hypothetical protein